MNRIMEICRSGAVTSTARSGTRNEFAMTFPYLKGKVMQRSD